MPWLRPIVGVILCSRARRSSTTSSASRSAIRMSLAFASCTARQVSSTSDEVMPWCMKRASGPTCSATLVREGDDVVLGLALDLVDPVDLERALFPDRGGGFLGHDAEFGERVGGVRLDLEPDLESALRASRSRPCRGGNSGGPWVSSGLVNGTVRRVLPSGDACGAPSRPSTGGTNSNAFGLYPLSTVGMSQYPPSIPGAAAVIVQ